ncbi:MAG: hypothetical protein WCV90_05390 [Candidatus Woesearchaeota archaeon]|jgi:hypothetical protein
MAKTKIKKEEFDECIEAHKNYDKVRVEYEEYLKGKDLNFLKKEFVGVAIEARKAYDLVEYLFMHLTKKKILDKNAFDRALLISALASRKELELAKKKR